MVRAQARAEVAGGLAHVVTEWLADEYALARFPTTYLSEDGEVCLSDHFVNVLADGTILDPTADQLGEGHDVRVVHPLDPDYERYRPAFDVDHNPSRAAYRADLVGYAETWSGVPDRAEEDRLATERGGFWWITDSRQFEECIGEQMAHADRRRSGWDPSDISRYSTALDAFMDEDATPAPAP